MGKFQLNVINLKIPKRKGDRKEKTMEDYLAKYFQNKGYSVLFSRYSKKFLKEELNYPSFFKDFPDFFQEKPWYFIPLAN
ncbi:MAG TPA: hypothetical protein ENH20_01075, partial [Candidatus Pacearchaeota archaeon]|nr:hypothetical protein [Candidatus Pacearchaeota archaeon]